MTRIRSAALAGELAARAVVMAAAGVAGAILFAVAEDGYFTFPGLILNVAVPAGAVIAVLAITAAVARWHRLWTGIVLAFWTGLAGTVLMEVIREIGFRFFHSMPGDLVQLMGVLLTNRIMSGPNVWSDLAGWGDHFWNGVMFAIPYVLIVGGFPRRGRHWHGALIGACYGALLATGFLISPVPRATGAGFFGDQMAPQFAITVYLAHLGFASLTGWLVHRFGAGLEPIWTTVLRLGRQLTRRDSLQEHLPAGAGTGHFRPRS